MTESDGNGIGREFIEATREAIAQERQRIAHSLRQLDDAQIWRRPAPQVNCIGNLILHLCGNLHQWFLHGFGGAADIRQRPEEFAESEPIPRDELLARVEDLFGQIDKVLQTLPSSALMEQKRIQGFEKSGLAAMYSSVNHLEGHSLQIAYITHMFTGNRYEPFWKPANPQQGNKQ
jgi:hypothetical protein